MKKRRGEDVESRRSIETSPRRHRDTQTIPEFISRSELAAYRKAEIARQTADAVNDSARLRHVRATTIVIFTSGEGGVAYTSRQVRRCRMRGGREKSSLRRDRDIR